MNDHKSTIEKSTGSPVLYGVLLVGLSLLCVMAFLPALFEGRFSTQAKFILSPYCHQFPSRSFTLNGETLAACHRCLGLYLGAWTAMIAVLLVPALRRFSTRMLGGLVFFALALMGLDWGLDVVGIIENTALSRTVTGSLFGAAIGLSLASALLSRNSQTRGILRSDAQALTVG